MLVSTPSLRPLSVFCSTAFANFQSTSKYRFPARVPEIAKSCVGSIRQHLAAKHPNALFRLSDARAPVVVCSPPRIGHVIVVQMATAPRSGAVFMFRCCCAMLLRCRCDADEPSSKVTSDNDAQVGRWFNASLFARDFTAATAVASARGIYCRFDAWRSA